MQDAGLAPFSEGERLWLETNLAPGTHIAICPIPDVKLFAAGGPPKYHVEPGMHRLLTVK